MTTEKKSPKVSVCIPTYNYGRFIADAIESVLCQTYADFELLIVDNCSTDNTKELVETYLKSDSRVQYICNETNLGMVGNWNRCLKYATGEYVKILCADDVLAPICLERQVLEFEKNPGVVLVTCIRQMTTNDLLPTRELRYGKSYAVVEGADAIKTCFKYGNRIGEPTAVMFRRDHAHRGFEPQYSQLIDQEMWYHLLEKGKLVFVPEILCMFRQHQQQGTVTSIRSLSFIDDALLLYHKYADRYLQDDLLEKKVHILRMMCGAWGAVPSLTAKMAALRKVLHYFIIGKHNPLYRGRE